LKIKGLFKTKKTGKADILLAIFLCDIILLPVKKYDILWWKSIYTTICSKR